MKHPFELTSFLYVFFICFLTGFTFPYYGAKYQHIYNYIFVGTIIIGAVSQLHFIIGLVDITFALMAFPTVISALLLSTHVRRAARKYFENLKKEKLSERQHQ